MAHIGRRQFIKISGASFGAAALGSGLSTHFWGMGGPALARPNTEGDKVVPTFCELCFWKCGVLAHVKDGQVTKLVGNPDHPLSRGRLCPRGVGGTGLLYDPDRLKTPLMRREKRGEQVFEPVSWDAALDYTAERMLAIKREHGPEALALFKHGFGGGWFAHLVKAYGSPNIAGPSYAQCRGPREAGYMLTFGQGLGSPEPIDIENARCITFFGAHLGENMHNTQVQELADAIDRGAQLVVVDPRYSTVAGKARYWLPIKPGTDIALLLAFMHVILDEKRYDAPYLEQHGSGLDKLAEHVKDKSPEWAYPITGIRPELIREVARFIASFKPASLIHPGRRATWYGNDTQRARAMAIMTALLGSWGRRGGYLQTSRMSVPKHASAKYPKLPPTADRPDERSYPMAYETLASGLCDATLDDKARQPIKAWLVYGTNLMQSLPDPRRTRKAIDRLDFIASIDVLPAEITGYSDVVLPESTYLERCDDVWAAGYKQPFVAIRQPVVEPMYESRPGSQIAAELAKRLGLQAYFPWSDAEQHMTYRLQEAGLDVALAKRTGVVLGERTPVCEEEGLGLSFDTPSKKIELYSTTLEQLGQPPMPDYAPVDEPPPGSFRLLFGRSPVHTFGRTTNNRFLTQIVSENEVWVNASAAAALPGFEQQPLRDGERVVLVNQDGARSNPVRAKVTQRIRGDCVYLVHGFGHSARGLRFAKGRGASDSELVTRYKVDPIMGGTGMNVNFVRIERSEAA